MPAAGARGRVVARKCGDDDHLVEHGDRVDDHRVQLWQQQDE
ncbi:hypothetical protein OHA74_53910 [Streptomyces phaeochromogenes]|nr:hypothetical protein [Streptomyces phaeochromogenes]